MDAFSFRARQNSPLDPALEEVIYQVIGAAIEVHRLLGPGLSEVHYKRALSHDLDLRRICHVCESEVEVPYKGVSVGTTRIDLLVVDRLILELKAVDRLTDLHRSQIITYLRLKRVPVGLLINFNVPILHDGIKRVLNTP